MRTRGTRSRSSRRRRRARADHRSPHRPMRLPRFEMERMQSQWEHRVKYDLSESGVEALRLEEITRDPKELMHTRLGYAEGVGREAVRSLVASFHSGSASDNVVITTGT